MNKLLKITQLARVLFVLLVLGSLFNPPSVSAQTCSGTTFGCCDEVDPYGECIGLKGPFLCSSLSVSECSDPGSWCERVHGTPLLFSFCDPSPPSGCVFDIRCGSGEFKCTTGLPLCAPGTCSGGRTCEPIGPGACGCTGSPPPTPTITPPPTGTPPPPTPTITPPPPVSGNARPRYQFSQLYPFPCNKIAPEDSEFNDFEFHSLRPYQASPCNPNFEDLALFCGNDLIITDPITIFKRYPFSFDPELSFYTFEGSTIEPTYPSTPFAEPCVICQDDRCVGRIPGPMPGCEPNLNMCAGFGLDEGCSINCTDNQDGTETCTFNIDRVRSIAVDLEGAYLPIMGFTEPSVGSFDRPDRVVNAYDQDENMTDAEKVNEYVSWYLHSIIGRAEYDPPDPDTPEGRSRIIDFSGPLKRLLAFDSQEDIRRDEIGDAGSVRHDQVVVCTNLLGQATECYPSRLGVTQRRMTNVPDRHLEYVPFSSTEDRLGKSEIASYSIQPPLSFTFRILSSAILSQTPATLYFAHMQEGSELGEHLQRIFAYEGADLEAEPEDWVASTSDFCDLRAIRSNPGDNLFAGEITATVEYKAQVDCTYPIPDPDIPGNLCRRLNEEVGITADCVPDGGRSMFCENNFGTVDCEPGQICGSNCVSLIDDSGCAEIPIATAGCVPSDWVTGFLGGSCSTIGPGLCDPDQFKCVENVAGCVPPPPDDINRVVACPNLVQIAFRTTTETPLAEDVWKRLVANPVSVFRRIFPQIEDEEGRPITRLFDMPAATSVIYSGEGVTVAGNPGSGRPANQAELYFPHIGGVHEYFLKCIQKTLRPEGFGEGCISGPEPLVGLGSGDCTPVGGTTFTGTCNPGVGPCSPGNLEGFFRSAGCSNPGQKALEASKICNLESGSNPLATNCSCLTGGTCDYSIGLFQINLLAHCAASAGFDFNCALKQCTITDQSLVDSCAQKYYDANENIRYMIQISGCGTNWTPWTKAAITCGLL